MKEVSMLRPVCHVSLVALAAVLWAGQAQAQACSPAAPSDGDTVTCDATGDGIRDDGLDDAIITVTPAGDVQGGADTAVEVDDDLTLDNDGAIGSTGDRGIDADKDAEITNSGTITAAEEAVKADDDATVSNSGTITSTGNRAVELEDDATVTNTAGGTITAGTADAIRAGDGATITNDGAITGGDEGIQADDGATVVNTGTIDSVDKGIAVEDDAQVTNTGTITSDDEGIETGDDATITNSGTIVTADDALNPGSGATVVNTGTLRVTADQDGIDLDDGTITNHGTIVTEGAEAAIDFDESDNPSTITNSGRMEGAIAINTDGADTQTQTVVNSGTILGRDGRSMDLGQGDDTLELRGGRIIGSVELGRGDDTLRVIGADAGALTFDSLPETVDMSAAPDHALFAGPTRTLAVAEPEVFAAADALSARLSYGLATAALRPAQGRGWWIAGNARLGEADAVEGTLTAGRDHGAWGVFVARSGGRTTLADGLHEVDQQATALGLRAAWDIGADTVLGGALFAGLGETGLDSPAFATGNGTADGHFLGLTARVAHDRPATAGAAGLALSAQAGLTRFSHDAFGVSGLGGARFEGRDVTTSFVALEAALPLQTGYGVELRPFVGAHALFTDGDDVTMRLAGSSTSFATGGDDSVSVLSLGAEMRLSDGPAPWRARLEAQVEDGGDTALGLGASVSF
jgi:hypothetical protein